ncbi:hypothetical protein DY000_02045755 [Brassica cretica]|uniref:Secreted protein n=1 Tax=Brassica cretica TaxID=69181 RepID=A0ABQ7EU01_BRACR|nr:hypothetical protein DY000_02045755 [Brassica cretica]
MQFCLFSVLLAHFPFLFLRMFAFFDIGVYPLKLDIYLPHMTDTKIQKRTQRRNFLRPDRSLCSEWRSDRSLRSDRAVCVLGRYVATELGWSSVATSRPSCVCARSLRSDRARLELGRYVEIELCACSVST